MERELWKALYLLAQEFDASWGRWRYSTADVVAVYFWAVVHDRPTSWAADPEEWPEDLRPRLLPPQSTLSRRLRQPQTAALMAKIERHLLTLLALRSYLLKIIDGKALGVSAVSKDPDAGYGRGAGAYQKGYKLHAVWSAGPIPLVWQLAPMNVSEKTIARALIPRVPGGGYLLGDTQYDVNDLYALATAAGLQLVAKKTPDRGRGGLGHRRQSPGRLRAIALLATRFGCVLYQQRAAIECRFGTLTSTGGGLNPLPAWVRRFSRVHNWVQAKILVTAVRWILVNAPGLAFA